MTTGKRFTLATAGLGFVLAAALPLLTATPAMAAGSCGSPQHSGTTAWISCSGFSNTGTFRVAATFCSYYDGCYTFYGNYAYLSGGTSTVTASGMQWPSYSSASIDYGPPGG